MDLRVDHHHHHQQQQQQVSSLSPPGQQQAPGPQAGPGINASMREQQLQQELLSLKQKQQIDRVAGRVLDGDRATAETVRLGEGHVVVTEGVDHRVAHADDPPAERGQEDRQRGENRMLREVDDEVPGEPWRGRRRVRSRRREPVQHVPEEEQQQQRRPEIREGAEERSGQRRQAVEPGAPAPGCGGADQGADRS